MECRVKIGWTAITVLLTASLLTVVQLVLSPPMLLGERLIPGGGWIQIAVVACFAGFLFVKMADRSRRSYWRRFAWTLFAVLFFVQLILGLTVDSVFLLTGKLHFPVPALILGGAVYRWELAFMPILFLVTLLLSGGAWCSQLCYFGAFDSLAASRPTSGVALAGTRRLAIRHTVLFVFIFVALALRVFSVPPLWVTILAAIAGLAGLSVILLFSRRKRSMIHCTAYCPIGTLVSYGKFLSLFRYRIDPARCTRCMACTTSCRYGALGRESVERGRIGLSCTYCGDCLPRCKHDALEYRFLRCSPRFSEHLYLCVVIVLYACFLAIARV